MKYESSKTRRGRTAHQFILDEDDMIIINTHAMLFDTVGLVCNTGNNHTLDVVLPTKTTLSLARRLTQLMSKTEDKP